jgi:hypothetical protein
MKRFGKTAVCLAGGLALNASLRAADPASANNPLPDNPYATVAVRNIFGLIPPAPPPTLEEETAKNLPKITPTGIMSVFGQSQVLFKVAAGAATKARQPAKEEFYILRQGQRQDDIEVTKIDEKNSLVTFDNHGTTQELPLANAPDSGASASSPPGPGNPGMTRGRPGGGGTSGPGGFTRFGAGPGGRNGGMGKGPPGFNGGNGNSANNGMDVGSSTQGRTDQTEASTMTPEESQIILAAQHLKAIQENNPTAPLYPPTAIDSQAGISQGADAGSGPPAP